MISTLFQWIGRPVTAMNRWTLRERILLLVTLLVVMGAVWHERFYRPLQQRRIFLDKRLEIGQKKLIERERQQRQRTAAASVALLPPSQRLARLVERERTLDESLLAKGLVPITHQERRRIEQLLLEQRGPLHLHTIERQPVAAFYEEEEQKGKRSSEKDAASEKPPLFRYPLTLIWTGSYLDAWLYLKRVEALALPLLWERFVFQSTDTGPGMIEIGVSTLSLASQEEGATTSSDWSNTDLALNNGDKKGWKSRP